MEAVQENPYKTPDATLTTSADDGSVLALGRFSAWGVFGLTLITLGLYPIYWLYTRAKKINALHEKKISTFLLQGLLALTLVSWVTSFLEVNDLMVIVSGLAALAYTVLYLVLLFKVRNRLQDILNRSGDGDYRLGGLMTFFFFCIYLQYKINQCIDSRTAA